jgi:hypothetical protein
MNHAAHPAAADADASKTMPATSCNTHNHFEHLHPSKHSDFLLLLLLLLLISQRIANSSN